MREGDGRPACRYCRRAFENPDQAETHIRDLARVGMLQDHIAIHWSNARW